MRFLALAAILLLAGCLDDPSPPIEADAMAAAQEAPPACTPADTNNYGTDVNGLYPESDGVWQESNGVPALQRTATCEGPADRRIAP